MAGKKTGSVAAWFEIPAGDFERAVAFYEKAFATKLVREKIGPMELAIFPHDPDVASGCVVKVRTTCRARTVAWSTSRRRAI